jgi:hypothetical protein
MKPNTDRPDACAIGDQVHAFVGGSHQVMSVQAAESLHTKLGEAIEKAKSSISEASHEDRV